jgi:polar amino acid transport system substrate-binding protein
MHPPTWNRITSCLRKYRVTFALASLFLVASVMITGCARKNTDTLVVGMELDDPPFELIDTQGNPAGVSVDMAHALGESLHKKVVIENIPFDGLIVALKTGKIDLVISSMTATEERKKSINFSEPYLRTGLCLLVGKNSGIKSMADADKPGKVIAVKKGTTGEVYMREHARHAKVLALDKESACVMEVVQSKADAFIYDQMSVLKYWQRNKNTTHALLTPVQEDKWAIGVSKENTELLNQVNSFLQEFKKNGGFDKIGDKWLKEQKQAFKELSAPFTFGM